jgi:hypothetical protein
MEMHDLKTWPEFFNRVWDGRKRAELRRNDRGFMVGDAVTLREFDPVREEYTGREVIAEITDVVRDAGRFGLMPGFVMFSFVIQEWVNPWLKAGPGATPSATPEVP